MAARERVEAGSRSSVRVETNGRGEANVATGVPVLDHLIGLLAGYADFDITLEVEPGAALDEAAAAGRALGQGLAEPLSAPNARRHGATVVPADEALAHVALEASGRPLVVSNVDLSDERVGGAATDVVGRFLQELAAGAGLTLHVRLIEGQETQHVLQAIFKALGGALLAGDRRRRAGVRVRPARCATGRERDGRHDDPGADRAGAFEHGSDPGGGGKRARPAREDDRLPRQTGRL